MVLPTRVPTKYSGTVPVRVYEAWSASTTPVKAAMNKATGSESTPTRRIWVSASRPHVATSGRARPRSAINWPQRPTAWTRSTVLRPIRSITGLNYDAKL